VSVVWVAVFAGIGIFFLGVQLIAETNYGFAGWVISAFMVGFFARRWYGESQDEIAKTREDDNDSS
jgi:hypothetical protein